MKTRRSESGYNRLTVKDCKFPNTKHHHSELLIFVICTAPHMSSLTSVLGLTATVEEETEYESPAASLKTDFMVVSVLVGPLLSLLSSASME